jgi:spermidine/putrescine transport system ATP-binding protein
LISSDVDEPDVGSHPLLVLDSVQKSYGSNEILRGIDLRIGDGEFLTVVGPSGSGKTTILRLIGGFTEPSSGDIRLDGNSIVGMPIFRRPFNTVFQDYALFPHLTVAQNVAYGLKVRHQPRREIGDEVSRTLALVHLEGYGSRYPSQLSGGQQQRVALARAIICRPRLILLDEPLGALDAELRRHMQMFLKEVQRSIRTTFLFITHDQEEAISMADRICIMQSGRLVQVGTPHDVYYRPVNEYVARFFGDNNLVNGRIGMRDGPNRAIETPIGTFRCLVEDQPAVGAANVGQPASMVVRPEAIRPALPHEQADNSVEVEVEDISFGGPNTHIRIRPVSHPGSPLKMRMSSSAGALPFQRGDLVRVAWSAIDCRAILAEQSVPTVEKTWRPQGTGPSIAG